MRQKVLSPILIPISIEAQIRIKIKDLLYHVLFKPLVDIITSEGYSYDNAVPSNIKKAIREGRINYVDGVFTGRFNAGISKELRKLGFKYNPKIRGFVGSNNYLPLELRDYIITANNKFISTSNNVINNLNNIAVLSLIDRVSFQMDYINVINNIDKQFATKIIDIIEVAADLTDAQKISIAKSYSDNLKLYIKDFAQKEVNEVRQAVQQNTFAGYRSSELKKIIQERYEVSERKAKFLAHQETSLLTTSYQVSKAEELGITKFKWSTSHDERVRHDHKILDGKIFSFDEPPIINQKTGQRGLPGEDFGCRCNLQMIQE